MRTEHSTITSVGRLGLAGAISMLAVLLIPGCPGVNVCSSNSDCDDGDSCTADACNSGVCVNDPVYCPGGLPIDLGNTPDGVVAQLDVQSQITSISIDSPPVVNFTVTTANGAPITGIGALWEGDNRFVRFTLTKLKPEDNGEPSYRVSYTRDETNNGSSPPDYDTGSSLVDRGDGTYAFTFNTDVSSVSGIPYEPTLSHRVAGQIGSGDYPLEAQNLYLDFVPAGGPVVDTRNIATVSSCNQCHGRLVEHGRRFEVEYCVNCHNPDLAMGEGDMKYMIHKLHSAQKFDVLDDGVDYSEVTYPQDLRNCTKCHTSANQATPDGDNWKTVPNMVACGSCHSDVNFETGENHIGGPHTSNRACTICHTPTAIVNVHTTENATPNNPSVPRGLSNFSYEIAEARVAGSNVLEVDVSILRDGTPMDLLNLPADLTSSPSFLFGYSMAQDGVSEPADFNNLGQTAGQPQSASLVDLIGSGSVARSATAGVFTVTVPNAFPAGAGLRTVGLQSRFRQIVNGEEFDRQTISAVRPVTGDAVRRDIVDSAKCADCHEWLALHGGSRVVAAASPPDQPQICTLCHNPSLSSSGRTANPSDPIPEATVDALGDDPLMYPERTNNFRDMIHGIHASGYRTEDFEFVRNRLNGLYYNWSEVTFPGILNNCETCHYEGTYELPLPDGVLMTTEWTTSGNPDETRDDILAARAAVPNGTDLVNTPTAATCYMCHDSANAVTHMELNGGQINLYLREGQFVGAGFVGVGANEFSRSQVLDSGITETCLICHGEGRIADVELMHGAR